MKETKLRFGTGGIPLSTKNRTTTEGIKRLRELGLEHLELEFVYAVYLKEKEAGEVKKIGEEMDVSMSVHGSYYTNLASNDDKKWHASISRLVAASKIGEMAGARSITFHSGFFTGQTQEVVFDRIAKSLEKSFVQLKEKNINEIVIAPELTGKPSQYGSIEELVKLVKYFREKGEDRLRFCVDFAHYHARTNGEFAQEGEFRKFFDYILKELGEGITKDLHMHMSSIEFSPKGERNHLTFLDSYDAYKDAGLDFPEIKPIYETLTKKNRLGGGKQDWKGLLKVLKEYKVTGFLVCESPNLEQDALLMQKFYNNL